MLPVETSVRGSRHSSTERTFADPTRSSERGSGSDKTPTRIGLGEFERGRGRFSSSSGEYRLGVGKGRSGRMPSPFKQCRVRARSVLEHGAPEAKSWRFAELCPQISKTSVVREPFTGGIAQRYGVVPDHSLDLRASARSTSKFVHLEAILAVVFAQNKSTDVKAVVFAPKKKRAPHRHRAGLVLGRAASTVGPGTAGGAEGAFGSIHRQRRKKRMRAVQLSPQSQSVTTPNDAANSFGPTGLGGIEGTDRSGDTGLKPGPDGGWCAVFVKREWWVVVMGLG
ncbi:unnamed protein product [Durusdinium trenchii]|uniref:Uncharacterized protein n=1 Tax=Durusdinium trenchii TaxID=1381693 RepID=A0ABP0MFM4_9DINO